MKKMTALFLIFAMLVSLSSAVAADEMSAKPTVEEILSEYHRNAFESKVNCATETNSIWARRSGNARTLEQETVDTLNSVGYEAYMVTTDNYESLEAELKTDFDAMGLEPNGAYIVVISGADQAESNSAGEHSTFGFQPGEDEAPDGGGETFYSHIYNGETYWLRNVTVTSTTNSYMAANSTYSLAPNVWYVDGVMDSFNTALVAMADTVAQSVNKNFALGTIGELLLGFVIDDSYTEFEPDTLTIHAATLWTGSVIQVWNANFDRWDTAQCSSYAISRARCVGYLRDIANNDLIWCNGVEYSKPNYSPQYNAVLWRKNEAVMAYISGRISYDRTGDIDFFLADDGEILYGSGNDPLFSHIDGWMVH